MKISILTGFLELSPSSPGLRDISDILRTVRSVGYDTVDIGFTFEQRPDFILRGDGWEQRIEAVGETAAKLGMTIAQSHLPTPKKASFDLDPNFKKPGYREYFDECMYRAYKASGMLGVPYGTVHPLTYLDAAGSPGVLLERNRAYYEPLVEWGVRCGVGTAFENMRPDSPQWGFTGRYCQEYERLIELVDSFGDPMVGVCWDTGHANQAMQDQPAALRALGPRLKNLHLNDNHYGTRDEHLLPFMGTVDWPGVVSALAEIGYAGVLNYEVGKVARLAPRDLQMIFLEAAHQNGLRLLAMYEEAERTLAAGAN